MLLLLEVDGGSWFTVAYVAHLEATFDPATCVSCSLFGYCRSELRASQHKADVLIEIGVPPRYRPGVARIVGFPESMPIINGALATTPAINMRHRVPS